MKLKTTLSSLFFFVLIAISLAFPVSKVRAESCSASSGGGATLEPYTPGMTHVVKTDISHLDPTMSYYLKVRNDLDEEAQSANFSLASGTKGSNGKLSWEVQGTTLIVTIKSKEALSASPTSGDIDTHTLILYRHQNSGLPTWNESNRLCDIASYMTPKNALSGQCSIQIYQDGPPDGGGNPQQCFTSGCQQAGKPLHIEITGLSTSDTPFSGNIAVQIGQGGGGVAQDQWGTASNGNATVDYTPNEAGKYTIKAVVERRAGKNFPFPGCNTPSITIAEFCQPEECSTVPILYGDGEAPYILCEQIDQNVFPDQYAACVDCAGGSDENAKSGVWTAIGCIRKEPAQIAQTLIKVGLMMGGGVALLMMLIAGFILSISQGDPKRTEEAKEMITAAFVGLIFVIFSVTILQFVGFTILRIPGFGG